jgi:hypothetical protein
VTGGTGESEVRGSAPRPTAAGRFSWPPGSTNRRNGITGLSPSDELRTPGLISHVDGQDRGALPLRVYSNHDRVVRRRVDEDVDTRPGPGGPLGGSGVRSLRTWPGVIAGSPWQGTLGASGPRRLRRVAFATVYQVARPAACGIRGAIAGREGTTAAPRPHYKYHGNPAHRRAEHEAGTAGGSVAQHREPRGVPDLGGRAAEVRDVQGLATRMTETPLLVDTSNRLSIDFQAYLKCKSERLKIARSPIQSRDCPLSRSRDSEGVHACRSE